ncbi:MAG: GMC family oxidoreductase N-terminal domain-containing protein [Bacteroidetes bacterium]|nr:GMC family oxidoreductase N-terminal domain-containing protein [Bacteroidota bacterium]
MNESKHDYDYIVIGSGFGGSVSAMRLAEKGYKVLVLEKGKWFKTEDFPKSNWNLRKWLWLPILNFYGFFKITIMKHITILSGVGVGGGSLVYANTLPVPTTEFFQSESWKHLADWENELQPFYQTASKMLGVEKNPRLETGDLALQTIAGINNIQNEFSETQVAVFFGEPEKTVADPYFNGEGPERSGCRFCGGCMVGCRYNAKNTLDKNYLHFALKYGAEIKPQSKVCDVIPIGKQGDNGYKIKWKDSSKFFKRTHSATAKGVIFAGGVLGTVKMMLELKKSSLPNLSDKVGAGVRTNSESLIGITDYNNQKVFSDGIAIGSILHTDKYSHIEPVRYPAGSGFWRLLMSPMVHAKNPFLRLMKITADFVKHPAINLKTYFVDDWAKRTQILLFMQTIDSTLQFKNGFIGMRSRMEKGKSPTAFIPEAKLLAEQYSEITGCKPTVLLTETLLGIPTTAHILGGSIMGEDKSSGVIDKDNKVFGYDNMYICDGSMISANVGVNPSLTITALSERAMSKIGVKG